jgi:hypothetical protein
VNGAIFHPFHAFDNGTTQPKTKTAAAAAAADDALN